MANVVTFDPFTHRIIEIDAGGDNELDWREIYSEWKVWAAQSDNLKYQAAFRVVGGDPISDVQDLGSTFFMFQPWKLRPSERDHRLTLNGNIYSDPAGESVIVPTLGAYTVFAETFVSNLVDASVARLDLAQLLDAVYIDTARRDDNSDGTNTAPVATIGRAFEVATANNLRSFKFRGSLVFDRDAVDWVFSGFGSEATALLDLNGWDVDGSSFSRCELLGSMTGRIEATTCKIDLVNGLDGVLRDCGFESSSTFADDALIIMQRCFSEVAGTGTPIVNVGTNCTINVRNYSGGMEVRGMTAGCMMSADLDPGRIVFDASNTGGAANVRGLSQILDNSNGLVVTRDGLVDSERINEMWQLMGLDIGESVTRTLPTGDGAPNAGTIAVGTMTFNVERADSGATAVLTRTG